MSIIGGKKLQFEYQAGSGPLGVNVETSYHLNDNQWHSVSVERNRYVFCDLTQFICILFEIPKVSCFNSSNLY